MRINYLTESFSVAGKLARKIIFRSNYHRISAVDFILKTALFGQLFSFDR